MHQDADLPVLGGRLTVLGFIIYHGRPGSTKRKCSGMTDISKCKCLLPHAWGGKGHGDNQLGEGWKFYLVWLGEDGSGLKTSTTVSRLPPISQYVINLWETLGWFWSSFVTFESYCRVLFLNCCRVFIFLCSPNMLVFWNFKTSDKGSWARKFRGDHL